jgi:hypothetical protein
MRCLLSLSMLLFLLKVQAQYTGGKGDGFELILSHVQNQLVNIYRGGNSDGFTAIAFKSQNKLPNLYAGGSGDGFVASSALLVNPLPAIYTGSNDDGSANALAPLVNELPSIYSGGNDDGATLLREKNQNKLPDIYAGGNNDGYAFMNATGQNIFLNIYAGGADDGYASAIATNQNKSVASLQSFSGAWQQEDAFLLWQISSPENVETFEIERSINNGQSFESLKKIKPGGNVTRRIMDYNYLDVKAFNVAGANIKYRIKWIDKQGNLKYSPLVTLTKNSKEPIIAVYPNPTNGSFILQFKNVKIPENYKYMLHNAAGVLIEEGNITSASTHFNLSRLTSASYTLSILKENKLMQNFTIIISR